MPSVLDTMWERRSSSHVTDLVPTHEELLPLVEAAGQVADHAGLEPWRLIEIRGDARRLVGRSLAEAAGLDGEHAKKTIGKANRASLLIAVVVSRQPSVKVPDWEQEAVASGVAHALSLLLHEQGYGAMWRTGIHTRSEPVRRAHRLAQNEDLLGWIYVGGYPEKARRPRRSTVDATRHLSVL